MILASQIFRLAPQICQHDYNSFIFFCLAPKAGSRWHQLNSAQEPAFTGNPLKPSHFTATIASTGVSEGASTSAKSQSSNPSKTGKPRFNPRTQEKKSKCMVWVFNAIVYVILLLLL